MINTRPHLWQRVIEKKLPQQQSTEFQELAARIITFDTISTVRRDPCRNAFSCGFLALPA